MVHVSWEGQPMKDSPFHLDIVQYPNERKVRAFGTGLCSGLLGGEGDGDFQVDTAGGGPGTSPFLFFSFLSQRVHW